jgi:glycosyltransferase involved in cell wall biosynthesis
MRILQICNKFPYPPKDGGAIAILNLTKGLRSNGHHLKILAMNTSKHYINPDEVFEVMKDIAEFDYVNINTETKITRAVINLLFSRLPYNAERFISKEFNRKLEEIMKEDNFDIVQLEGLYLLPYIKIIRKLSDAKIVFRAHNIEHEIWNRIVFNTHNIIRKKYLQILAKRINKLELDSLNSYDLLIPITKRDAKILNDLGNNKPFHVCPSGLDIEKATVSNTYTHHSLFFIGSLDWIPNREGLLWFIENVWTKINNKEPELKFFIAGRNAPKKLAEKLSNYRNIIFEGEVEDASQFMQDKSIMVVPLLSGSGMRVKIIEGMSLGKAVITTTIGAEGIDIKHSENILIADSADDFKKEIENLLENKSFFTKIGENARSFVIDKMDNRKITASLSEFYKKYLI